jgi:hypothetical protein
MDMDMDRDMDKDTEIKIDMDMDTGMDICVLDTKSQNIPEVVIVRRGAGGVLGIWEGWVNWGKGGADGVSLQAT